MSPTPFAPPAYGAGVPLGYDSRYTTAAQYPFVPQPGFTQAGFTPTSFGAPSPFVTPNPYLQSPGLPWTNGYGAQPGSISGQPGALQVGSLIGQLAQQIVAQCAIGQQTGLALIQLAQQLIQQGLHTHAGVGADSGHLFGGQPFMTQPFMPQPFASPFSPFAHAAQSPYGGFSPQVGASWSTARPPTIQ